MITCIPEIVKPEELLQLAQGLGAATFADGSATAGWHARAVKNNLQLTIGMEGYEPLEKVARSALLRDPIFQMAVRPRYLRPILFNRHDPGMTYGPHVDDPVMTSGSRAPTHIRTDVSFTLFLSDPATYQGGELVIGWGGVEQPYKLPAGALIAYPSSTLHRVARVTEGVRLAAVGWVQSEVRDPEQRAILFDLDLARRNLFKQDGKNDTFDVLSKIHANLLRMWVEL